MIREKEATGYVNSDKDILKLSVLEKENCTFTPYVDRL